MKCRTVYTIFAMSISIANVSFAQNDCPTNSPRNANDTCFCPQGTVRILEQNNQIFQCLTQAPSGEMPAPTPSVSPSLPQTPTSDSPAVDQSAPRNLPPPKPYDATSPRPVEE